MRLFILLLVGHSLWGAAPALTFSATTSTNINSGGSVTFSYGITGKTTGSCANTGSDLCEVCDQYFACTNLGATLSGGAASGTITVSSITKSSRFYLYVLDSVLGPGVEASGKYPFIVVAVGSGTLSATITDMTQVVSRVHTINMHGIWELQAAITAAGCGSFTQTVPCTGLVNAYHNPDLDVVGYVTVTGATSGTVITRGFRYCAKVNCSTGNEWAARIKIPTAENWTYVYAVGYNSGAITSNYVSGSGSFSSIQDDTNCSPAVCSKPLKLLGSANPRAYSTSDGRPLWDMGWNGSGAQEPAISGRFSNFVPNNAVGAFNSQQSYLQWAAIANTGFTRAWLDGPDGNGTWIMSGCISSTCRGGIPSGESSPAGGFAFVPSTGNTNFPLYNTGSGGIESFAQLVGRARELWRVGSHNFGEFITVCSNSNNVLLPTSPACSMSTDPTRAYTALQVLGAYADTVGPYLDGFTIENGDPGGSADSTYINSVPPFLRNGWGLLVSAGQAIPGAGASTLDFTFQQAYIAGKSQPSLNAISDTTSQLTTRLGAYTGVVDMEEGGNGTTGAGYANGLLDSDAPAYERLVMRGYAHWFVGATDVIFAGGSGSGVAPVAAFATANQYLGTVERGQANLISEYTYGFNAADAHTSLSPTITPCTGKTFDSVTVGGTNDIGAIIANKTDRNSCAGATFAMTFGAAMQGAWYDPLTGKQLATASVASGSQTLTLPTISSGLWLLRLRSVASVTLTTVQLPNALVGTAYATSSGYTVTLGCQGGTGPYTFAVTAGALAPGLSLNASTGVISGTPTLAMNSDPFEITCSDSIPTASAPQIFRMMINPAIGFNPSASALKKRYLTGGTIQQTSQGISLPISGGMPPITCTFTVGTLSNTFPSATYSGACAWFKTPVGSGTDSVTVQACDALSNCVTNTLIVNAYSFGPFLNPSSVDNETLDGVTLTIGQPFAACLLATNPSGAATWTSSGLPPGMSVINTSGIGGRCNGAGSASGYFAGTPTTAGTYTATVGYTDGNGTATNYVFTLIVAAVPSFTGSTTLTSATASTPYFQQLSVSGGSNTVCRLDWWTYLPLGFTLDPLTCSILGTTTQTGTWSIPVVAVDNWYGTISRTYSLTVNAASGPSGSFVPSGTLTCSGTNASGSTCASLMDFNPATFWSATATGQNAQVDFGATVTITALYVIGQDSSNNACGTNAQGGPNSCFGLNNNTAVIEGSANGSAWTLVDTLTSALAVAEGYPISRLESASYRYFRVRCPSASCGVAELQFVANAVSGINGQPVAPVCTPFGGNYPSGSKTVTCSSLTTSASLYYTTDGSTPVCTSHGTLYSGPVALTFTSTTFEIIACDSTLSTQSSQTSIAYFKNYGFQLGDVIYDVCTGIPAQIFTGATIGPIAGKYYRSGSWWTSGSAGNSGPPPFSRVAGPEPIYIFTSTDLYNWCSDGQPLDIPSGAAGFPNRPQLSYNPNTGVYQIFGYQETTLGNLSTNEFYIATSTTPNGPISGPNNWSWTTVGLQPDGHILGDFSVWVEPGACYLVSTQYVASPQPVYVTLMNTACTASSGTFTDIHTSISPGQEGFTFFKRGSEYFIISSQDQRFGWSEPQAYSTATNPVGTWSSSTTLYTSTAQSSRQFQVPGKIDCWIFYSDNWAQPHNTSPTAYVQMQKMTFPTATSIGLNNTAWDLSSCPNSSNPPAAVGNTVFGGQVQ